MSQTYGWFNLNVKKAVYHIQTTELLLLLLVQMLSNQVTRWNGHTHDQNVPHLKSFRFEHVSTRGVYFSHQSERQGWLQLQWIRSSFPPLGKQWTHDCRRTRKLSACDRLKKCLSQTDHRHVHTIINPHR